MSSPTALITLITTPECHLCDVAREVIRAVADECQVTWEEKALQECYSAPEQWREQVPVTLVGGQVHAVWRVRPSQLRAALQAAQRAGL